MELIYKPEDKGQYKVWLTAHRTDSHDEEVWLGTVSKATIETSIGSMPCWRFHSNLEWLQSLDRKTLGEVKQAVEAELLEAVVSGGPTDPGQVSFEVSASAPDEMRGLVGQPDAA